MNRVASSSAAASTGASNTTSRRPRVHRRPNQRQDAPRTPGFDGAQPSTPGPLAPRRSPAASRHQRWRIRRRAAPGGPLRRGWRPAPSNAWPARPRRCRRIGPGVQSHRLPQSDTRHWPPVVARHDCACRCSAPRRRRSEPMSPPIGSRALFRSRGRPHLELLRSHRNTAPHRARLAATADGRRRDQQIRRTDRSWRRSTRRPV